METPSALAVLIVSTTVTEMRMTTAYGDPYANSNYLRLRRRDNSVNGLSAMPQAT